MGKNVHEFTKFVHELRGQRGAIAKKALEINLRGIPFSSDYFQNKSLYGESYGNCIKFLNDHGCLERAGSGNPRLWKFRGTKLTGDSHRFTLRDMGVGDEFCDLLEQHRFERPSIHDIKLKIPAIGVHDSLAKKGANVEKSNKRISMGFDGSDNNLIITASIYPSIIQIDISNTFNPLVIDITSMLYLYEQLSKFSQYIFYFSDVSLPPVSEWIVTQFHLHTDLSREYTGKKFEFKINDLTCGMIRFYSKHIGNGMNITRLEQIRTPRTSYVETMNQLLFSKDSSLEFYYV